MEEAFWGPSYTVVKSSLRLEVQETCGTGTTRDYRFRESSSDQYGAVTEQELADALCSLNKGKTADVYGLTTDHLSFAADTLLLVLTTLMNSIFSLGDLPDSLKLGMLTPVFKKKGSSLDAKNYRGITILPVLSKLLESVLRARIEP